MNQRQLSERIGNMDDRLVQQAEQIPAYGRRQRRKRIRSVIAIAAIVGLMACSFSIGTLAFAKEIVVEIPVGQESIEMEELGLTLLLPDTWEGKYALERSENGREYQVYHPMIREAAGGSGGMLFYIMRWDDQLTKDQVEAGGAWDFARCEYIMTTKDGTYLLYYASDVQFTQETEEEYRQMEAQIDEIRFVIDDAIADE